MGFRFFLNFINPINKSSISRIASSSSPPYSKILKNFCGNPNFKIPRRWNTGHSHHGHQDHHSSGKEGERIFRLGLMADIGLAAGKAFTGYISGSTAIIADAAHSVSDVVLSGVALLSFQAARAPKDKEHPYGHGKFETLGALGISAALFTTAGGIAWHALDVLMEIWTPVPEMVNQSSVPNHDLDMEHPILALNMAIVSIAVKEGLYWITKSGGEKIGSGLMKANARHHRADAVSSVVALIGVGGSILGVRFFDPLAGLVVSGMIFKAGFESGHQSILELVDAAVPSENLEPYECTIMGVEGVKRYNHLRGRRAGSCLYLDLDVEVDPFSSVSRAYYIGENVRNRLQLSHPEVAEVFIHIEPATSHMSGHQMNSVGLEQQSDVEDLVSSIVSCHFSGKMEVHRITRQGLRGNIFRGTVVSMPTDALIRDAMEVADEAEKKILEVLPKNVLVFIHLRLGRPMPDFQ